MSWENELSRANQAFMSGDLANAEQGFRAVLAVQPEQPDAWHGLGLVAWMQGRQAEAEEAVRRALAAAPGTATYMSSLGDILRMAGRLDDAEAILDEALAANPDMPQLHNNRGMVHLEKGDWRAAIHCFAVAAEALPDDPMPLYNLGVALREAHYPEEAILAFRKALRVNEHFQPARIDLALTLLQDGQWQEGFQLYEARHQVPALTDVPRWDGMVAEGKTLLVFSEQGLGDTLQFVRYLPFIAAEGMRVILQCQAPLLDLMQSVEGIAYACTPEDLPTRVDYQISLLSLPFLFDTHVGKVPTNIPYLRAPYAKVQAWRERLDAMGPSIKIGLRWMGNPQNTRDAQRSIPLERFAGWAGIPNVTFLSLQDSPLLPEEEEAGRALGLVDVSAELKDFTDTAALVSNLDLIISVDTAVLHLAGALGAPAWALLRFTPHWVWLMEGEESVWYPGTRLYRQPAEGDWDSVLLQVEANLRGIMGQVTIGS